MKKWIAIITATACCFSSVLPADGAPPMDEPTVVEEPTPTEESPAAIEPPLTERKSVGKAAEDGSTTASSSTGKYWLAAGAVAAGVVALVLISRNSGHH